MLTELLASHLGMEPVSYSPEDAIEWHTDYFYYVGDIQPYITTEFYCLHIVNDGMGETDVTKKTTARGFLKVYRLQHG